jgi:peptide deformylase
VNEQPVGALPADGKAAEEAAERLRLQEPPQVPIAKGPRILRTDNIEDLTVLRAKCEALQEPDIELETLLLDAIEHTSHAWAVAAPQVGRSVRAFAYKPDREPPVVCYNPEIIVEPHRNPKKEPAKLCSRESCLSSPGAAYRVWRFADITLGYMDKHWIPRRISVPRTLAAMFQHEVGHLDGEVIADVGRPVGLARLRRRLRRRR